MGNTNYITGEIETFITHSINNIDDVLYDNYKFQEQLKILAKGQPIFVPVSPPRKELSLGAKFALPVWFVVWVLTLGHFGNNNNQLSG